MPGILTNVVFEKDNLYNPSVVIPAALQTFLASWTQGREEPIAELLYTERGVELSHMTSSTILSTGKDLLEFK